MNALTIKIPLELDAALTDASMAAHINKSEMVRRALLVYLQQRQEDAVVESALTRAGELVGCIDQAPPDLASNPQYLADFGRV